MVESFAIDMLWERFGGRRRWMGERVGGGDDKRKKKKKRVTLFWEIGDSNKERERRRINPCFFALLLLQLFLN
jgi:hypothetical protein